MDNDTKIVEFWKYCETCKHYERSECEDPCWDCLDDPVNIHSHKPTYWEAADEKSKDNGGQKH